MKTQQEIYAKLINSEYDFTSLSAKKHIYRGVPSRYRNTVWIELSRNPHGITKEFYSLLAKKSTKLDPSQMLA